MKKKIKKYNILKRKYLNQLFDNCINEPSIYLDNNDYTNNVIIKKKDDYELLKDELLDVYILCFKDIIVIHLNEEFINDFEFLYKDSDEYLFEIYYTILPNLKLDGEIIKTYHIFCISKKLDLKKHRNFIKSNDCNYKYLCLNLFYGSCIIVNNRFDIISIIDKSNAKYTYLKSLGQGKVNFLIKDSLRLFIKMTNTYKDILPPHYLKI